MSDSIVKAPLKGKAPAPTDAAKAKGEALALVCIQFGESVAREEHAAETGRAARLNAIKDSILALGSPEAHSVFRTAISKHLNDVRERIKAEGSTGNEQGYSLTSFVVRVSQWRAFSKAITLGFNPPKGMKWAACLTEAVAINGAHAKGESEANMPTRRKAGRKETPALEKMLNSIAKFREANPDEFIKLAAWVQREVEAMPK